MCLWSYYTPHNVLRNATSIYSIWESVGVRREKRSIALPVEEDGFDQCHHVSTRIVTCAHDGHVDGLWRETSKGLAETHEEKERLLRDKDKSKAKTKRYPVSSSLVLWSHGFK